MKSVDSLHNIQKLLPTLTDWYWKHGSQRSGAYGLSSSSWLDDLLGIGQSADSIVRAQTEYSKATLAIWGPSQTGKSTLLAEYIDGRCDDQGNGSALQWNDQQKVRFVGELLGETTVLNPYNQGADASGCVTRYVSANSVRDADYPVQMHFASDEQIMHALAVGYLSETVATDDEDLVVKLDPDSLKKLTSEIEASGPPNREAFENLVCIANTLEMLISSNLERYQNLQREWKSSLRRTILGAEGLLSNVEATESFAQKLFWDSWTSITGTFKALKRTRLEVNQRFGDLPVFLSYELAAQILNISAVELAGRTPAIADIITSAGYEIVEGRVIIGRNLPNALFRNLEDFALFQGLVWEIIIPLRADIIRKNSVAAADLLEVSDILDFPGVANEFKGENLLTNEALTTSSQAILTKVLKRGKTASIAVTSSKALNIDGFSLLMRMNRYPANPVQLNNGIRSWWKSFGKTWPPSSKELPLNLVLTFTAALVNGVSNSGVGYGLEHVFEQMKGLAYLADPKIVNTFATNYPQFSDGVLHAEGEKLDQVVTTILEDKSFQRQFGSNAESFREAAHTGGKNHLLSALALQAKASLRPVLLAEKEKRLISEFNRLLRLALPGEQDASAQRQRDLDLVLTIINQRLTSETSDISPITVGREIQEIINVDPEGLDTLPMRAARGSRATKLKPFIEKQLADWREQKTQHLSTQNLILGDMPDLGRLLTYFVEEVDTDHLRRWFITNLGNIKTRYEASESRRFLAAKMNNELLAVGDRFSRRPHRNPKDTHKLIRELADNEFTGEGEITSSPYYAGIIAPFLEKVAALKTSKASERGVQEGDSELLAALNVR